MSGKLPGKTYLKVTGIFYFIGGLLSLVLGLFLPKIIDFVMDLGLENGMSVTELERLFPISLTLAAVVITVVRALLALTAGFIGVKFCNSSDKAQLCFVFGIILIAVNTIDQVLNARNGSFQLVGVIISYIVPVLYFIGAKKNKEY